MPLRKDNMRVKQDPYDVGVIVGRFQVPELHGAHLNLIQHVLSTHQRVVVFLGLSPLYVTRENPLDFDARKQMLLAAFPEITVGYIKDVGDDVAWSHNLDRLVQDHLPPGQTAVLYGGRDSFVGRYHGALPARELEQEVWVSGTDIRKSVSKRVKGTPDFRAGVVWAAYNRFPTVYATVDVAIVSGPRILLGRKEHEPLYRLIGGFSDPGCDSFEDDARREVREEAGVEISSPRYLGSCLIDDWRYRGEVDKIRTLLFIAEHVSGDPRPGDDIHELRWFDREELLAAHETIVVPNHRPLIKRIPLGDDWK